MVTDDKTKFEVIQEATWAMEGPPLSGAQAIATINHDRDIFLWGTSLKDSYLLYKC